MYPLEEETWAFILIYLDHESQYGQVQQKHHTQATQTCFSIVRA